MKKILLIATGGTIACSESENGLKPALDAKDLIRQDKEIADIGCYIDCISVMCIDSTEMTPKLMAQIAVTIGDNYGKYDGFVITHGTDTMAYSAAALTYMLRGLNKPVVLTGSQIAMQLPGSDAYKNLCDAVTFACSDNAGVFVAFDGHIINGTHAVKVKTHSKDGFASINLDDVAYIDNGNIVYAKDSGNISYRSKKEQSGGSLKVFTEMCCDVISIRIIPGMKADVFEFIGGKYKGIILEGFGMGGIPGENPDIAGYIGKMTEAGSIVAITTQCLNEGIDLSVYEVGRIVARHNIVNGASMTTEALSMKMMWAIANIPEKEKIKQFIETSYFADRGII